ncbi:hypothetical protein BH10ACI4_BH10ACI4_35490 [soil metagenome]
MAEVRQPVRLLVWAIALPIAVAVLAFVFYLVHHHNALFQDQQIRTLIIGIIGLLMLVAANQAIIRSNRDIEVKFVIAFDVVLFIVLGMVALISAAPYWGMASLCAGTCLFGGGIIGLLFGLPLGSEQIQDKTVIAQSQARRKMDLINLATAKAVAANEPQQAPAPHVVQAAQIAREQADTQAAKNRGRNLLSETASSLGKLLAGASLAKFGDLFDKFKGAALTISRDINPGQNSLTLGGSLILYFGLIGFISGLLLPAYFMGKWQDGGDLENHHDGS